MREPDSDGLAWDECFSHTKRAKYGLALLSSPTRQIRLQIACCNHSCKAVWGGRFVMRRILSFSVIVTLLVTLSGCNWLTTEQLELSYSNPDQLSGPDRDNNNSPDGSSGGSSSSGGGGSYGGNSY